MILIVIVEVVLQKIVIEIENEEEFLDAGVADYQMFCKYGLICVEVQLFDLDFESELFG